MNRLKFLLLWMAIGVTGCGSSEPDQADQKTEPEKAEMHSAHAAQGAPQGR
jgi:hypothetical protein